MASMNVSYAIRLSAVSLLVVGMAMVPVAVFAVFDSCIEGWASAEALGTSVALAGGLLGGVCWAVRPESDTFGRREAFFSVCLTWMVAPVLSGLPYYLWAHCFHVVPFDTHPFQSAVNCYFEAMSGLTTTGASILANIEAVPRGLLLWRAATNWLGGLGIVLLFVAVLPIVGVKGRKLHLVESTGPAPGGDEPRIRDTARVLWISYLVLTVLTVVALRLAGLPWYNAVCETFGAIATGGFSVRGASIAAYRSSVVEWLIVAAMVAGAVNFALYVKLAQGRWRQIWRDPELRLLLTLLAGGSAIVAVAIHGSTVVTLTGEEQTADWLTAIRYGVFNLVSMHTDSGFATADFDRWPFAALGVIVLGTLIGGSSGSTTGGFKVSRLITAAKILLHEVYTYIRPKAVEPVRVGGRTIEADEQLAVLVTILLFVLALMAGTVALMLIGAGSGVMDMFTAFSGSLAALCTAGPGFGGVGPDQNYLWLPDASKLVLCFLMLIGRLEIVPVLAVLHLRFWSAN